MNRKHFDLVVIGGGPAGMAGAFSAYQEGITSICIIEREHELGGILKQCIHNGFGLRYFQTELTGPEYAHRWIEMIEALPITILLDTTVLEMRADKSLTIVNQNGVTEIMADKVLLTTGCRERTRGAIRTPGYRPAGIYTAGAAQKLINIDGYLPGKSAVILGSGDIGLIMARRLTLEGATVQMVCEIEAHSSGLERNIVQCLEDFNIPLHLSTTITQIHGKDRVEGVTIAKVDEKRQIILESQQFIPCDTVLFSVGLIPENELAKQMNIRIDSATKGPFVNERLETNLENVYAAGNCVHVHDLVDDVSTEATRAAIAIAMTLEKERDITITHHPLLSYVVPQKIQYFVDQDIVFSFRGRKILHQIIIDFISEGIVVYTKENISLYPGEMSHITLPKEIYQKINQDLHLEIRGETV